MCPKYFEANFNNMLCKLMSHHDIFYKLAELGCPRITTRIPTACVKYYKESNRIGFEFNPNFIEKLTEYEVLFIMCHEMQHILLEHNRRFKKGSYEDEILWIATDLAINQNLICNRSFKPDWLPNLYNTEQPEKSGCFVDTMFDKAEDVRSLGSTEYYYNLVKQESEAGEGGNLVNIKLQHGRNTDEHTHIMSQEELLDLLTEAIGGEDARDLMNKLKAGVDESKDWLDIIYTPSRPKPNWESVVGKLRKTKHLEQVQSDIQWLRPDRRASLLNREIIVPSKGKSPEYAKWDLWVFTDRSGSCSQYVQPFLEIAKTIPRDDFEIRYHVFCTEVEHIRLDQKGFRSGGGTCFYCIERYIRKNTLSAGHPYPKLVFVITDGHGTNVQPHYPNRWHWFLTDGGTSGHCPTKSHVHYLKDFNFSLDDYIHKV